MTSDHSSHTVLPDRRAAGQSLIQPLAGYAGRPDVIVLALPRGGVPVAFEVATALGVRLDIMLVRKLGFPSREEFAMGAIASGGIRILNENALRAHFVDTQDFDLVLQRETDELERREHAYRATRPPLQLKDQVVVLIDDGIATGASMMAAIHAVRTHGPARIVVAVPVAAVESAEALRTEVDELICPLTPQWLLSIGSWYSDFLQVPDDDVLRLLHQAWKREADNVSS
jgi:predicted phosphoribosyltransferase